MITAIALMVAFGAIGSAIYNLVQGRIGPALISLGIAVGIALAMPWWLVA